MKNVIFISALLCLYSCKQELPTDGIDFSEKMVVNLLANNDEVLKIHVGKTLSLIDSSAELKIEDAKVTVTDENANISELKYSFLFGGKYISDFIPAPNTTYRLSVTHPKYPMATATFTIPAVFKSSGATWEDNTGTDSTGFPTGTIYFTLNDDGKQRNYYEIALFRYEDLGPAWEVMPVIPENAEIAADPIFNPQGALILEDAGFNGQSKNLRFSTPFGSNFGSPYKYLVVVKSLSQEYYKYLKSLEDYRLQGGLFSDPTAIYNNIKGGVGISAGASISKDTIR